MGIQFRINKLYIQAVRTADSMKKLTLSKAHSILSEFGMLANETYQTLPPQLKKVVTNLGRIHKRIQKNLVCLKPRRLRKYGKLVNDGDILEPLTDQKNVSFFEYLKSSIT